MKLLSLVIALNFLGTNAWAGNCSHRVASVTGAAATMIAGYGTLRWLSSVDLEAKWTQIMVQVTGHGQAVPFRVLSRLALHDGDKITVNYRLSADAPREIYISQLSEAVEDLQQELHRRSTTYFSMLRADDPDLLRLLSMQQELQKLNQGLIRPSGRELTQIIRTQAEAEQFFRELHADQAWVTKVSRVPALRLRQIAAASRQGLILGAVALGFGLVTAEEIASCRLSRARTSEVNSLR